MSSTEPTTFLARTLPRRQPAGAGPRLLLFGIRQIGVGGLSDAATAHAFVTAFGAGFRRPLLLLRTLMAELSSAAAGPIQIAPWCCPRMTPAEGAILDILNATGTDPARSHLLLADLLGRRGTGAVFSAAAALASAFEDAGLPLDRD
jgi:hypothetical protein